MRRKEAGAKHLLKRLHKRVFLCLNLIGAHLIILFHFIYIKEEGKKLLQRMTTFLKTNSISFKKLCQFHHFPSQLLYFNIISKNKY